jgi:hypothetical protein
MCPTKANGCPVTAYEIPSDPKGEFDWTGGQAHEVIVRVCSWQFRINRSEPSFRREIQGVPAFSAFATRVTGGARTAESRQKARR